MLCAWRKHVVSTRLETREPGAQKFTKCSICTSELTFLGRRTAKNGVIGAVAAAQFDVTSAAALERLRPGALSFDFLLLITLYMGGRSAVTLPRRRRWSEL